ncbi:hypothetical protein [Falsibacillus albus]|uniref:DUF418 domain-containing protein n=1 Tax=Falsibacillus albus TaxID=2478915 RepID=A0A3L7JY75_9BACI|nr:hypothetical protein [Falsibacillus albus]RLQ95069.1 hypothetical protein D9X91_11240 [Falsibacillus albus]
MFFHLFKLLIGIVCGYLFITWLPPIDPFNLSGFIVQLVLDPIRFFAASTAFFVGFINNAKLFQQNALMLLGTKTKKQQLAGIALFCAHIGTYFFFIHYGAWEGMIFFSFSIVYGMISIDFMETI